MGTCTHMLCTCTRMRAQASTHVHACIHMHAHTRMYAYSTHAPTCTCTHAPTRTPPGMESDHTNLQLDAQLRFLAPNYGTETMSETEYYFVLDPTPTRLHKLRLGIHMLHGYIGIYIHRYTYAPHPYALAQAPARYTYATWIHRYTYT